MPVNGDGSYDAPSSVDLTLVGTYTWSASYSGDSLNNGAVDNGDNESVASIKAGPSISDAGIETGSGVVGTDSTLDSATISGWRRSDRVDPVLDHRSERHTSKVARRTVNGDGSFDAPSSVRLIWSAPTRGAPPTRATR